MILRKILGVAIGVVIANLTIYGSEWLLVATRLVGLDGLDYFDEEYLLSYGSLGAELAIIAVWGVSAATGAFVAFAVGRSDWTGWLVAAWVAVISALGTFGMYPHPIWVAISAIAAPFVGSVVAFGLYRRWRAARLHLRH